jgi:hypothetical protein
VKLEFDTHQTPVEQVVQQVMAVQHCLDINIADPPLEEIIGEIYTNQEEAISADNSHDEFASSNGDDHL